MEVLHEARPAKGDSQERKQQDSQIVKILAKAGESMRKDILVEKCI